MPRPITHADFEAVFKVYADKAVKHFNMTGEHPPQLFAVKLGKQPGELERTQSLHKVAAHAFSSGGSKDAFAGVLRELTTPGSDLRKAAAAMGAVIPDIVVQINEAWVAHETRPKGVRTSDFLKQQRTPPSERPDRGEVILIVLHTTGFSTMGMCAISDTPTRHAAISVTPEETAVMTGRMSMTQDDAETSK